MSFYSRCHIGLKEETEKKRKKKLPNSPWFSLFEIYSLMYLYFYKVFCVSRIKLFSGNTCVCLYKFENIVIKKTHHFCYWVVYTFLLLEYKTIYFKISNLYVISLYRKVYLVQSYKYKTLIDIFKKFLQPIKFFYKLFLLN